MRRWIGFLFAIGSVCFVVGPAPGFVNLVGSSADGTVFFVGSIFFTSAALLQFLDSERPGADWWAALVQLAGTVYFNISTFQAMQDSYDTADVDRIVWRPELFGSICFLASGFIAYQTTRGRRDSADWRINAVNLLGCVLFMVSAITGYVLPETGNELDLAAANLTTSLGALCFLVGAVWLGREPATSPRSS